MLWWYLIGDQENEQFRHLAFHLGDLDLLLIDQFLRALLVIKNE